MRLRFCFWGRSVKASTIRILRLHALFAARLGVSPYSEDDLNTFKRLYVC